MTQQYGSEVDRTDMRMKALQQVLGAQTQMAPRRARVTEGGYTQGFTPEQFPGGLKPTYINMNPIYQAMMGQADQIPQMNWGGV